MHRQRIQMRGLRISAKSINVYNFRGLKKNHARKDRGDESVFDVIQTQIFPAQYRCKDQL
jgi:hypothetical protein